MDANIRGTPAWAMKLMQDRMEECLAKGKSDHLMTDLIRTSAETTRTYQFYMRAEQGNYSVRGIDSSKKIKSA